MRNSILNRLFGLILTLGVVFRGSSALFEDQAFKFDWRQQHIGVVNDVQVWYQSLLQFQVQDFDFWAFSV